MKALIDADVLRYRVPFACEYTLFCIKTPAGAIEEVKGITKAKHLLKTVEGAEIVDQTDVVEPWGRCKHSLDHSLAHIRRRCKSRDPALYLTGKGNFREQLATIRVYKGNRPDRKPMHYPQATEYLLKHYGAILVEGMEADDAIAIAHAGQPDAVTCSVDKDFAQLEGKHFNFVDDEFYTVTAEEALHNLYVQILAGDSVDNIQGIPKVGKAKANAILAGATTEEEMYAKTLEAYKGCEAYKDDPLAALVENARLVYLLRYPEDMWEPPCGL